MRVWVWVVGTWAEGHVGKRVCGSVRMGVGKNFGKERVGAFLWVRHRVDLWACVCGCVCGVGNAPRCFARHSPPPIRLGAGVVRVAEHPERDVLRLRAHRAGDRGGHPVALLLRPAPAQCPPAGPEMVPSRERGIGNLVNGATRLNSGRCRAVFTSLKFW